ncbi:MAG: MarR family transcriptional regulator [Dehalococcoidia bacterium]|nr:MarR family transcriptional regulator [Dehalococcoidia bacterium]
MLDPSHPAFRRWALFAHSYLLYTKRVERALAPWDLSLPQYLTLFFLRGATAPVTPSLLASYLTQEAQSVTSLLQRMESRTFVQRAPHPEDGRSIVVEICDEGRRALDECVDVVFREVVDFFSPLPEESQIDLEDMLRVLRDQAAESLGLDIEKLDYATRRVERDPDMFARAQDIRDAFVRVR